MNVLVTHPGRQHSHQLARALHDRKALAGYWTGVPAADPSEMGPVGTLLARLSPQPTVGLPACLVRHNVVMPVVRRLAEVLFAPRRVVDLRHRAVAWFDAWAARRLPDDLDAVVCYENGARETFRAAKKQGVTTILDAASFHHTWQDAFYNPVEFDEVHRRITNRKDEEIEQAEHILTVSKLARESYLDAGVAPERVTAVPMGVSLTEFRTSGGELKGESDSFTFLFVGHAGRLKGVDVLLRASSRLKRSGTEHVIQFAGGHDEEIFENTKAPIVRLGYLSRSTLAGTFENADCLILPSRFDSFGRVVVEALAMGVPAIVSEPVGAKEAIVEGETGWVVPAEDVTALADQMRWCVEHPDQVQAMRDACVETARDYSWEAYHERVMDVIVSIVDP